MIAAGIQPIRNPRRAPPSAAGDAVDASGVDGVVMSFPVGCIDI
jgi:hypothetical protein